MILRHTSHHPTCFVVCLSIYESDCLCPFVYELQLTLVSHGTIDKIFKINRPISYWRDYFLHITQKSIKISFFPEYPTYEAYSSTKVPRTSGKSAWRSERHKIEIPVDLSLSSQEISILLMLNKNLDYVTMKCTDFDQNEDDSWRQNRLMYLRLIWSFLFTKR